jgi:hypothetical protein
LMMTGATLLCAAIPHHPNITQNLNTTFRLYIRLTYGIL